VTGVRRLAVAVAVTATLTTAACSSGGPRGPAAPDPSVPVHVDERNNGKAVDVAFGGRLIVTLHSTAWQFQPSLRTLQQVGPPVVSAEACSPPGSGCGTVEVTYNAAKIGTTTIRARRSQCGEARRCTGTTGEWSVTVRVS
jgi:hypothetical protein